MQPNHIQKQRGGTLVGFIVGLIVGLTIAVIIAMMITKTPMPFNNKQGKTDKASTTATTTPTSADPNQPMYGNRDAIKDLIKNSTEATNDTSAKVEVAKTEPAKVESGSNETKKNDKPAYYIQAGAFRTESDANDMNAKLALLGFEAHIVEVDSSKGTLYRVSLGPFKQDEMNRIQSKLTENSIKSSATRPHK